MTPKFCTQCAGPLTWRSLEYERQPQPICSRCGHVEWQNPKPTVSAFLVRCLREDGPYEVLLVRRAVPPREGAWDCPGGFIDVDEHPEAALHRELQEELGVEAKLEGLVGIFVDRYGDNGESTLNIYYRGAINAGALSPASDISDAAWFPLDQLPEPLAFENNRQALQTLKTLLPHRT